MYLLKIKDIVYEITFTTNLKKTDAMKRQGISVTILYEEVSPNARNIVILFVYFRLTLVMCNV